MKKAVLKMLVYWKESCRPVTLLKETPTQIFSSEYCKLFKNTYFEEHLLTAAEQPRAAAFVLALLLSSDNLLTGYEKWSS